MFEEAVDVSEFVKESKACLRQIIQENQSRLVEELQGLDATILTSINSLPDCIEGFDPTTGLFVFSFEGIRIERWVRANLPTLQLMQKLEEQMSKKLDDVLSEMFKGF